MSYEIRDNFLPLDQFRQIQNKIFDHNFPWRLSQNSELITDKGNAGMYFTYSFFSDYSPTSDLYQIMIIPILRQMNCLAPLNVRTNMFLSKLFDKCNWHTDYNYNSTTSILYLNSCNGGTEFKINNEIKFVKSEENRLVTFPAKTEHRVCTSTDSDTRCIINFNYF